MSEESTQGTDGEGTHQALPSMPGWLRQLYAAAAAMRELAQAQWHLMGAEWRLARSAAKVALLAVFLGAVLAAALGLVLLALACLGLAYGLGSWVWALGVMSAILILCLVGVFVLLRRCLHWMSLPATRANWRALAQDMTHPNAARHQASGEAKEHETASTLD